MAHPPVAKFIFPYMCGRYTITKDGQAYWRFYQSSIRNGVTSGQWVDQLKDVQPNQEVKPTNYVPILRTVNGVTRLDSAHWWLLPFWANKAKTKWRIGADGLKHFTLPGTHFNSKKSTLTSPITEKGRPNTYWPSLLAKKRCAIPMDGFIEWPDKEDAKARGVKPGPPGYFGLTSGRPFLGAGVWEEAEDDEGQPFLSANLITTEPNELLSALPHHRMPAILRDEDIDAWLDPKLPAEAAEELLVTTPADRMESTVWKKPT